MPVYSRIVFFCILVSINLAAGAQGVKRIELLGADIMTAAKGKGSDASRLVGNVRFKHESTLMNCDSAFLFGESNSLEAFGNVVINNNDSIFTYGQRLYYDGNTRVAQLHDQVKMVDNQMTLTTEHLTYNMSDDIGTYYNGGKIVDQNNVLTSKYGYYFAARNEFFFKKDVVLTNPEYVMYSDTLMYNTSTEVAYFYGPTQIIAEDNKIWCENGWYDTRNDISQFSRNARLEKNEHTLRGDSLFYDRNSAIGKAFRNVSMTDTVQNMVIYGQYAEYLELAGRCTVTDSALAVLIEKEDSLFLHADTLLLTLDSLNDAENLLAWYGVKFFRKDLQGACDSMQYSVKDSIIEMFHSPLLWSEQNQLSATKITIYLENSEVRELMLHEWGLIIEEEDSLNFNQVKGKTINAFFENGRIVRTHVVGNAETVYYIREDDGALLGINKGTSLEMIIFMDDDSKVESITFLSNPVQTLFPPDELPEADKQLKGFIWEISRRPASKEDVFEK